MNTETAFLDCNIWSVDLRVNTHSDNNFFLVESIYHYNSLTSGIVKYNPTCVQVPEFEIRDLHLLDGLDYDLINKFSVPILSRIDGLWKIDLSMYHNLIEMMKNGKNTNM
jgi:hypothetical protein